LKACEDNKIFAL